MYTVRMKFPRTRCYTTNHNRRLPYEVIHPRAVVFIVDFTFPIEDMKRLAQSHRVIWCDHHDPINTYPKEGFDADGNCRIEPGTSGTSLVYELLYPGKDMPKAVQLVADYDTWQLEKNPDALFFNIGIQLLDLEITKSSDDTWTQLCSDSKFVDKVIGAGKHISTFDKTRNDLVSLDCGFETTLDGVKALAINMKNANSKVLDSLDPNNQVPFRVLYCWFGNIKKYRVSVYSADEAKYDAGAYCRQFGGDGRASCAGFVCTELPFPVPEAKDSYIKEYRQANEPLVRLATSDPLVRKHNDVQLRQIVRSIHTPMNYLGYHASFLNHPCLLVDGFYITNANFQYDIGVLWCMLKNGWYRLSIYPLHDAVSLTEIARRSGGEIVGDSVMLYQKTNPMYL